ncbi:hypothetical protein [Cellulomonas shaoxiangyii]|uniref:YfhO family protein n=1 Tax=Cellulomonas shaoxiangyii TaxID=2566013 RepID=A0A4P7SHX1_9CELL|nr:hypothetical protein [Cellulomonas shaoxiangyii]QCB93127.1 hypothetical protein E5225_05725 [Cellulomonas shaoxiangyii]TGY84786.1 hypothetical protein E5226_09535 [Cellulomonas shaoxiangyii]
MSATTVATDRGGHRTVEARRHPPALRGTVLRALPYVVSALLATVGATWALRVWQGRLDVPFTYWGDAVAVAAHVRTTLLTGWYERQPLLGVPHGQTFHDFPTSDDLHLVVMRLLGVLSDDWGTVLNLYFLLGFPLAAVTATYFLRRVGAGTVTTVVTASLFALAPYHFVRGEAHLYLASYWVLPPVVLLVVRAFRGEPLWRRPRVAAADGAPADADPDVVSDADPDPAADGRRRPARRSRLDPRAFADVRTVATLLACVLVGTASAYYAVFTVLLLAVAGAAAWAQGRDWRRLLGAAAAAVLILLSAVAVMLPDMLHARLHGENVAALARDAEQAEVYALKLTSLLLPIPGHVVPQLAALRDMYDTTYPLPSERPALGAVGAVGLVALLVVVVVHLARRGERPWSDDSRWSMLLTLGGTTLVALLLSTVGGVGSLISLVTPNIRGWSRMSIIIALLALAAVALLLDDVLERLRRRTSARSALAAAVVGGAVLVAGGTIDQVSPSLRPDRTAVAAEYDADAAWVTDVERTLGADAALFQLPYMPFPESPARNGVFDADQLKGFLHSNTLRWSGGGIKGRATSDWPALVATLPTDQAARQLAVAGFDGVVLDLRAFDATEGPRAADEWRAVTGDPVVVGAGGRYVVHDLRGLRDDLEAQAPSDVTEEAGEAVTRPATAYAGAGVEWSVDAEGRAVWTGIDGVDVLVDNAADTPRRLTVRFTALNSDVRVTGPAGERMVPAGEEVALTYDAEPGRHAISVRGAEGSPVAITAATVELDSTPLDMLTVP